MNKHSQTYEKNKYCKRHLDMQIENQHGLLLFEESIKSKYTRKNYISNLNLFGQFAGICCSGKLLDIKKKELQNLIEDYVIHLRQVANPNSIPSMFRGIKHFCVMNRIDLDWNMIHKLFPQKEKTADMRAYTTREVGIMISHANSLRDKALIHFLASTGARIGVFDHALLIKHLQKMPSRCMAVLLYGGTIEEYWAFLTPQATKALCDYHELRKHNGEIFSFDTPVFTTSKPIPRQLGWSGTRSVVYRILSKSDIRRKQGKRFDIQADHGFRKRYNTILKMDNSINYNIAEKLMGHKNGLDGTYFVPSIQERFTEFRKVIKKIEIKM